MDRRKLAAYLGALSLLSALVAIALNPAAIKKEVGKAVGIVAKGE